MLHPAESTSQGTCSGTRGRHWVSYVVEYRRKSEPARVATQGGEICTLGNVAQALCNKTAFNHHNLSQVYGAILSLQRSIFCRRQSSSEMTRREDAADGITLTSVQMPPSTANRRTAFNTGCMTSPSRVLTPTTANRLWRWSSVRIKFSITSTTHFTVLTHNFLLSVAASTKQSS